MFDPQVVLLALGAWTLGVLVGLVGAARHAFLWYVRVASRAPLAVPPRFPNEGAPRPLPPSSATPQRTNGPRLPTIGRVVARGICLICGQRWGTCDHTRNG